MGCGPAAPGPSLVPDKPRSVGCDWPAVEDEVQAAATTAEVAAGNGDGALTLVSASTDSLTVRWTEDLAPEASGFVLRWRPHQVPFLPFDAPITWWSSDVDAGERTHTIPGLTAATRYVLRLTALDTNGAERESTSAEFETSAPPVQNLSVAAVAHETVRLSWDNPAEWDPRGYVAQWRRHCDGTLEGRLESPGGIPGRIRNELRHRLQGRLKSPEGEWSELVFGLAGGVDYEFRVTARTASGGWSRPATVSFTTAAAPATTLRVEVSSPTYCIAGRGLSDLFRIRGADGPSEDPYWAREGIESVPVQWRISGGEAPYVVSVAGVEKRSAAGTVEVTCDALANIHRDEVPVFAGTGAFGSTTITIEATDATGVTIIEPHTIEVIRHLDAALGYWNGWGLGRGGTYYDRGRYFEALEDEFIGFKGIGPVETPDGPRTAVKFHHSQEGPRHTEAAIDHDTGERIGTWVLIQSRRFGTDHYGYGLWRRDDDAEPTPEELAVWDRFVGGMRRTPFPAGDPRNEPPPPLPGVDAEHDEGDVPPP